MTREFQLEWIESGPDKDRLAIYSGDQLIGLVDEASFQRIKNADKYDNVHPHPAEGEGEDRSSPIGDSPLEQLRRRKIAEDEASSRLSPKELTRIANHHAGFLDGLEPERRSHRSLSWMGISGLQPR